MSAPEFFKFKSAPREAISPRAASCVHRTLYIDCDEGGLQPGFQLLNVRTKEVIVLEESIPAVGKWLVKRAQAGSAAWAVRAGDIWIVLGRPVSEGFKPPEIVDALTDPLVYLKPFAASLQKTPGPPTDQAVAWLNHEAEESYRDLRALRMRGEPRSLQRCVLARTKLYRELARIAAGR